MKQKVYSYVIVFNPEEGSKKQAKILKSGLELATSEKILGMKLVRNLDKKWAKELENIEIIVNSIYNNTPAYGYVNYVPGYATTGTYGTLVKTNSDSIPYSLTNGDSPVTTFTAASLKNN